jgi:hypothetical protein
MGFENESLKTGDLLQWAESRSMARVSDPETAKEAAADIAIVLTQLEREFLSTLRDLVSATSNEVAAVIAGDNFGRRNTLRRRASDLLAKGMIEAIEPRVCTVTGKRATVYKAIGGNL